MTKRNTLLGAILVSCVTLCTAAPVTIAQGPIRVQTNQVLVPVFVLDKERVKDSSTHPKIVLQAMLAGDTQLVDTIVEGLVIRNLTATDFQVFEDG
jgi:hypothetical protein